MSVAIKSLKSTLEECDRQILNTIDYIQRLEQMKIQADNDLAILALDKVVILEAIEKLETI